MLIMGRYTFDFVFADVDEGRRAHHIAGEVEHHPE